MTALGGIVVALGLFAVLISSVLSSAPTSTGIITRPVHTTTTPRHHVTRSTTTKTVTRRNSTNGRPGATPAGTYGVGTVTLNFVDQTRTVTFRTGLTEPRPLTTIVRYPTVKSASGTPGAAARGPFPLIIFGHGFNEMPGIYHRLLRYWASAGFIVAAPIFPLENRNAPGGPLETDLVNQPQDMSFVITSLLQLNAESGNQLTGLINPKEIAVSGQSDGGDTALATAYDPTLRDPRVKAAMILSGAEIPWLPTFTIAPGGPPLLATQGTRDDVNLPKDTGEFFDSAPAPKFLLKLLGAHHLGPYTNDPTQLPVVEQVTTAFLHYYLERDRAAMQTMLNVGNTPGIGRLLAYTTALGANSAK